MGRRAGWLTWGQISQRPVPIGGMPSIISGTGPCGVSPLKEQIMQRRIGEHDAQALVVGCDRWRNGDSDAFAQQDDRAAWRGEERSFIIRYMTELLCSLEIAHHDRKGLHVASLALAQLCHRAFIRRIAGEVKAAESLDRDYVAFMEKMKSVLDYFIFVILREERPKNPLLLIF